MRSSSPTSSLDSLGRRKRRSSVRSRQHTSRHASSSSTSSSSSSNLSVSPKKQRRHHDNRSRRRSTSRHRGRSYSRRRYNRSRSRSYLSGANRNRRIEGNDSNKKVEKAVDISKSTKSTFVPSNLKNASTNLTSKVETIISDDIPDEEQLRLLFGFNGFDSTKGKIVQDNLTTAATGACRKDTKREYRQYMNRLGGFNRPLDKR
ncbi:unnamed protein product [Albugo candida]|uniref:U4/U6.U5 small nuclear ribonucleoprotein 27kDa protein domain-containing protein n=1 Tax=Albugo candida TaxID=65357 RepID=A0A024GJD9_9STRA|nr:unnamed protein product [Albugo candida]|eukprot:CCI46647.1 unnamed protein product [Albugo candida]